MGAGPGAFSPKRTHPGTLPETVRPDEGENEPQTVELQPQPFLSGISGRVTGLRLHPLGKPELFGSGLAKTLLSFKRRVCRIFLRTDEWDQLGPVWSQERESPLPGLHGSLRIRTDSRTGRDIQHQKHSPVRPEPSSCRITSVIRLLLPTRTSSRIRRISSVPKGREQ